MGTKAVIFIENKNGKYLGNEICYDGYVELEDKFRKRIGEGAGYILAKYWNNKKDIEKLIKSNSIKSLGYSLEDTDFMDFRQIALDNLTFDEITKLRGYSYIYIYQIDKWFVSKTDSKYKNSWLRVDCFLDDEDPDKWIDDERFWN